MRGTGKNVKKKSKPPDQVKQSQLFVETAKAIEVDESGKAFELVFKKIVPNNTSVTKSRKRVQP